MRTTILAHQRPAPVLRDETGRRLPMPVDGPHRTERGDWGLVMLFLLVIAGACALAVLLAMWGRR